MNQLIQAALKHAAALRTEADAIERDAESYIKANHIASSSDKTKPRTVKRAAPAKRVISAEGRRRIAEAQKKRWAAHRGQA